MIGKGAVCALALLILPLSSIQLRWVLAFLLAMLVARNIQLAIYAYQNIEVVLGMPKSEAQLLGYRNHGDHIRLLVPVMTVVFILMTLVCRGSFTLGRRSYPGDDRVAWGMGGGLFGACLLILLHFRGLKISALLAVLLVSVGLASLFRSRWQYRRPGVKARCKRFAPRRFGLETSTRYYF